MSYKIQCRTFSSMKEIFDCLEIHSKIPHEEYESVKLYGESSFIIDALKYAITEYSDITIASIDIILSDIDPVCKDLYVLSLTEENELYIQPAYNGENMYRNEAKFAIVQDTVSSQLVKDMSVDDLSSTVLGTFIFNK